MVPRSVLAPTLLLVSFTLAPFAAAHGQAPDPSTEIDLKRLWKEVLEVNSAWLDPWQPSLHYTLTGSVNNPERPLKFPRRRRGPVSEAPRGRRNPPEYQKTANGRRVTAPRPFIHPTRGDRLFA